MTSARFAFSLLVLFGLSSAAHAQCDPRFDRNCNDTRSPRIETQRPSTDTNRFERYDAPSSSTRGDWGRDSGGGGGGGQTGSGGRGGSGSSGGGVTGNAGGEAGSGSGGSTPAGSGSAGGGQPPSAVNGGGQRSAPRVGSAPGGGARPLQPVRAYLRSSDIPPAGTGAYGLVVFHSRATPASRSKLKMVCTAFVAFFPRRESATVPLEDQMTTVWPLDNPDAIEARNDNCDYAVDHYDLIASQSAMSDAQRQHASFAGEGPYLVGWSPSNTRGVPDALVLVVDMSADNSQADIDSKFLFWKNKIIDDPSAWRNGWSVERVRVAIHNFANQYGQSMLDAIKLIGGKQ